MILALLLLLLGGTAVVEGATRVLVVGIRDYPGKAQIPVLRFAEKDSRLLQDRLAKTGPAAIPSGEASLLRLHKEIGRVLLGATRQDSVWIIISARGSAGPEDPDGYVLTTDAARPTAGFKVSELRQMIEASDAKNVLVMADVAREPLFTPYPNVVNGLLMRNLSRVRGRVVEGIVGSEPGKLSEVDAGLRIAGREPGFGVFSYYVAQGLAEGLADTGALYGHLVKQIPRQRQVPVHFSAEGQAGTISLITRRTAPPILLASLRPLAVLAQMARALPQAEPWEQMAMTLADRGQQVIARYGAADYLPDDPLRVTDSDFAAAARDFSNALRLVPDTPENQFFRRSLEARRLFCEGRAEPNTDSGRDALVDCSRRPEGPRPETLNALGIHYFEARRDYARAVEYFREAVSLAPYWAYPRHNLALAYAERGGYSNAERELKRAIAGEPDLPYLHYNLGLLLQRTNRRREARQSYRRALTAYEAAIAALEQRATEWRVSFPAESDLAARRAVVFRRNRAEVHNALGTLHQAEGDRRDALREYTAAIDANPKLWVARYNRALALEARDPAAALQDLEMILKQEPDNQPARRALERLHGTNTKGANKK